MNIKPYKSIESFYAKIKTGEIFLESAFEGCSLDEVKEIETFINYSLPTTIRDFLILCGKKWRGLDVLHSLQNTLLTKKPYQLVRESISRSTENQGLSKIDVDEIIIIEFVEHLGDYFWSFISKNDECTNPKVTSIYYEELSEDVYSFTQFIENRIQTAIKFAETLYLPDYMRFQRAMEYVNPNAVKKLHLSSHEFASRLSELFTKLPNIEEVTISYIPCTNESWEISVPEHKKIKSLKITAKIKKLTLPERGLINLEFLDLNTKTYLKFPGNIHKNLNLTKLKLSSCELKDIPDDIYLIGGLKYLNLHNNNISSITTKIKNLKELEDLNINDNSFSNTEIDSLKRMIPSVRIKLYRQIKTDNNV